MAESNQVRWVGVQDTEPVGGVTVKQSDPSQLKATVTQVSNVRIISAKKPASATQIAKSADANNAAVLVHTVSENKTFFLASFVFSAFLLAPGYAAFYVNNNLGILQYYLSFIPVTSTTAPVAALSFNPPVEIPTGWLLKIFSSASGLAATVFISGYEE